ncbi:MAG: pre-rRNA-processing protein esf1 [Icmadophila ericetorum]|nr:pre-rRNA-processing protein esf1 [Icmadophila ericetorum]
MSRVSKQKRPKGPRGSLPSSGDQIMDPRFANIQTDPRFRLPSKKNTHVKIDKRFVHMLRDERFSSKAKVDRYGRKLPKNSGKKELERFYRVEDEEDEDEDDVEVDEDKDVEKELRRMDKKHAAVKDVIEDESESSSTTSSSSEESSDEEEEDVVEEEEVFGLLSQQGEQGGEIPTGEITSRIAVVNLDWDNIRAADLMAVFSSFMPKNGRILKVSVYPSEFGKERMEREEMEGPPIEIFVQKEEGLSSSDDEEDEDDAAEFEKIKRDILKEDEGKEFDSTKLRRYQLERLRYHYAVLICSSKAVAESIYNAVDGTEYLTTANFFDLRFIPDDMDFSTDKPRDECERIPDGYKPNDFVTDALQHSKVSLTWDADDGERKEVQRRAFAGSRTEINENDLKAYLGSDSSEGEEELDAPILNGKVDKSTNDTEEPPSQPKLSKKEIERQRFRGLLGLSAEPVPSTKPKKGEQGHVGDMHITFSSGLSSNHKPGTSVFENSPIIEETTAEKYIRKEKERKARRKEKMRKRREGIASSNEEGEGDGDTGDAAAEPTAAAKNGESNEDLGFDDPFFTDPLNDKSTTALRKAARAQKRAERVAEQAASAAQRAELELLMVDENPNGSKAINHFDMNEIAKAEKALAKKKMGRKAKLSAREKEALKMKEQDAFRMDVEDPRFQAVFERNEFAIDPSHARFRGTEGMRMLLEEGRRKRKRKGKGDFLGEEDEEAEWKKGSDGKVDGFREGSGEQDVRKLVDRVKKKVKRV